jgi:electron transfer flavoprotein alpha subunit
MKTLLVFEHRRGRPAETNRELLAFAAALGGEFAAAAVGGEAGLPAFPGKLYLGDPARFGEYDPSRHADFVVQAARNEAADRIVFLHSCYGWDLAPRVAARLKAAQISDITGIADGSRFEVACCNGKMRRLVRPTTPQVVLTIQEGAFPLGETPAGTPVVELLEPSAAATGIQFDGYEEPEAREVDLAKAEVVVSAGRGIGKKDHIATIAELARNLNGEMGASRPVVDAGWVTHNRQVGATGQVVSPKLYVACAVSGAMHHLAGMRNSDFIVAINTDREAPISEVADVLVVADVMPIVAALNDRLRK